MTTFPVALGGAITPSGSLNAGRVETTPGVFLAVSEGLNFLRKYAVWTSTDGINWTSRSSPLDYTGSAQAGLCAATDGSRIVVGGQNGTTAGNKVLMYSDDKGLTWTAISSPFNVNGGATSQVLGIWYSPERSLWMAAGTAVAARVVATSPDGITWTAVTAPTINSYQDVTYQNGFWWLMGRGNASGTQLLYKSNDDGSSWTHVPSAFNWNGSSGGRIERLVYNGSLYVAVGQVSNTSGNGVQTSPDSVTWTSRTPAMQTFGLRWDSTLSLWLIGGFSGIYSSPDGTTYTQRLTSFNGRGFAKNTASGLIVAVARDTTNRFATSTDGINWTGRGDPSVGQSFNDILFLPGAPPPTYVVNEYAATSPSGALSVARIASIGSWVSKALPPSHQPLAGLAAHSGKLYLFGGQDPATNAALTTVACYDPATNSWSSKASLPTAQTEVKAITVGDDIWIFGTPTSGTQVYVYHPLTNTYSTVLAAVGFMGNLDPVRVVYVPEDAAFWTLLTNSAGADQNKPYRMDPAVQSAGWVQTGPARPGSWERAAVAASGRTMYFVGSAAHSFDVFTHTWTTTATPSASYAPLGRATVHNDEVWVAGGSPFFSGVARKVELYDPVANTWRLGPYDLDSNTIAAIEPNDALHPVYIYRDADGTFTPAGMFEMFFPAPIELETDIEVDVDVYPFPWLQTAIEVDVDFEDNALSVPHARVLAPGFIHTGEE